MEILAILLISLFLISGFSFAYSMYKEHKIFKYNGIKERECTKCGCKQKLVKNEFAVWWEIPDGEIPAQDCDCANHVRLYWPTVQSL